MTRPHGSSSFLDPHIYRSDNQPAAWVIRAAARGAAIRREFADHVFGGTQQALDAARRWRDAQPWYSPVSSLRPLSRVGDVRRYETQLPGNSHVSAFWYFSFLDDKGNKSCRKFSVAYLGEEGARQKALRVRADYRRELEDTDKQADDAPEEQA